MVSVMKHPLRKSKKVRRFCSDCCYTIFLSAGKNSKTLTHTVRAASRKERALLLFTKGGRGGGLGIHTANTFQASQPTCSRFPALTGVTADP